MKPIRALCRDENGEIECELSLFDYDKGTAYVRRYHTNRAGDREPGPWSPSTAYSDEQLRADGWELVIHALASKVRTARVLVDGMVNGDASEKELAAFLTMLHPDVKRTIKKII